MMLSNQLQISLKGLLAVPAYPSYFSAFYAASDTTDTHPGPLMENKGHGWGTDHHLSRLLFRLVSAYVNLFHFLPDLVCQIFLISAMLPTVKHEVFTREV